MTTRSNTAPAPSASGGVGVGSASRTELAAIVTTGVPATTVPAAPAAPGAPIPPHEDEDLDDDDFWDKDEGGFADRVKEEALQSRASDMHAGANLGRNASQYRQLNKLMEADHVLVDMNGAVGGAGVAGSSGPATTVAGSSASSISSAQGRAATSPPMTPVSPGTPGTPMEPAKVVKRSSTRSQTKLVTATLQPNVSSKDSVTAMRRGTVTSLSGGASLSSAPGTMKRRPSKSVVPPPISEARGKPNVGEVKDSFQWLDEDLEEKDPLEWDRVDTKCSRCLVWWSHLAPLYQYLIWNCAGIFILMIPGIVDIIFFIENPNAYWANFIPKKDAYGNPLMTLGGYVVFIWSLWAAITLFVATSLLYLVPYLPYLILRMTYLVFGTIQDDFTTTVVQFSRVLNTYIVWFLASLISAITFGQMMPGAVDVGATVSALLSSTAGVAILWLGIKCALAIFGRNFQNRIFRKRVEANRFRIFVLEKLYQGITEHLDRTPEPEKIPTLSSTFGFGSTVKKQQALRFALEKSRTEARRQAGGEVAPPPKEEPIADPPSIGFVPAPDNPSPDGPASPSTNVLEPAAGNDTDLPAPLPTPISPPPATPPSVAMAGANNSIPPASPGPNDTTLDAGLQPWLKSMQDALQVVLVGGEQITEEVADNTAGVPLGSLKEAKMLARDLFVGLLDVRAHQEQDRKRMSAAAALDGAGSPASQLSSPEELPKGIITIEQFTPFIQPPALAAKAFEIFDNNLNAQITRQEMKETVIDIYNTRVTLSKSMKDTIAAIAKLDGLVGSIGWTITVLVYAANFVDISEYIAAFAAFWAGFAFAFQKTITNIVESVIFLFMTHPFDVGDRVTIDGESYYVTELGLMSTIFTHVDGRQMYASNPVLSQKEIYNVLRSGGQTEVIDMRISVKTTTQQLERLAQQLNTEIKTKFMKDFFPDLECYVTKVDWEQETMSVELWLNHRLNFQNGRARWIRSTNFAKILRQAVAEVGLEGGKMEVINLVGVSDWFAAIENQGTVSRQTPRPSRMLPEGFVDNSPAITVENVDENDDDFFQGDGDTGIEGERL